jgi:hypothetical protein
MFGGLGRPIGFAAFLALVAFAFDLAAFIYALTNFPYDVCRGDDDYKGCKMLKAAIGLDCVLW